MLSKMNLHEISEYEELRKQRLACGWDYSDVMLHTWRQTMDEKNRFFFWITTELSEVSNTTTRVGHIALDRFGSAAHGPIAETETIISTFFVLEQYRSLGLGRIAMDSLEDLAKKELGCTAIVLNAISRWYGEDEEGRATLRECGHEPVAKGRSNQDWYGRRGYVVYDEKPMYAAKTLDGRDVKFIAVCMRKPL